MGGSAHAFFEVTGMAMCMFLAVFATVIVVCVRYVLRSPKTHYLSSINRLLSAARYSAASMYIQYCDPDELKKELEYYLRMYYRDRDGFRYCNAFELYRIIFNRRPKNDYFNTIERWSVSARNTTELADGTLGAFRKVYLNRTEDK